MKRLIPYIRQMGSLWDWIFAAMLLGFLTMVAAIGLLTLSGWFITATAIAGAAGIGPAGFNFFTPAAGVRGFAMLRTAARYLERITSHEATFRLLTKIRVWLYRQLEPLGPSRISRLGSGELLNRLLGDVDALDNLYLRVLSPTVIAVVGLIVLGAFIAIFSPAVALVALIGLVISGFVVPLISFVLGRRHGEAQLHTQAGLRTELINLLQGMADLRIYGGMSRAREQVSNAQEALLDSQKRMGSVSALAVSLMTLVSGLTLVGVLVTGVAQVSAGVITPVQMAMLFFAVMASFELVSPLPMAYQYLGKTLEAARRLDEVVKAEPDIRFEQVDKQSPVNVGAIRFDNVTFGYEPGQQALEQVSFAVEPGSAVAVVGHSGSGKSSLINLLVRFWDVQSGSIQLGDVDLREFSEATLRSQCSVMSQPVQLFSGTLRENLQVAADDLTDEQMEAMLKSLDLWSFGDDGLDYLIGEGGNKLSGGQRKRLGLARALLRDAPVLLLDEPTEGLDRETEAKVLEQVLAHCRRKGQTLVWITHHLQHLDEFDQAVVLDNGHLIETGRPQVLLNQEGSRLRSLQELPV